MCSLLKRKEKYLKQSEFKAHPLSEIMPTEKLNIVNLPRVLNTDSPVCAVFLHN